jgi:hypothetical protein
MKNFLVLATLAIVGLATITADARPRLFRPVRPRGGCAGGSCSVASATSTVQSECVGGVFSSSSSSSTEGTPWHPLAMARARACAERGVGHWLGCPAGCFEGAGSGATEDQAIRNCCFWGQRRPRAIATVQRGLTWYAVVLYE